MEEIDLFLANYAGVGVDPGRSGGPGGLRFNGVDVDDGGARMLDLTFLQFVFVALGVVTAYAATFLFIGSHTG